MNATILRFPARPRVGLLTRLLRLIPWPLDREEAYLAATARRGEVVSIWSGK